MNRLDYISTYLLFFAYPYPANGSVSLEEEFWDRFKTNQVPRRLEDRSRYYEVDLENVWNVLRVTIENVETTVQYAPLEIAHITREGTQGIEIKPEPSVDLKGTVKGKIETPLTISSSLKTTVEEKLLKELDRRSSWLNPERNMLRLTQRGLEAINISGGLKERVTLQIPASTTVLSFLDFVGNEVKVKSTGQPVYKRVTALSVSIGVVREPYEFRRSASEKYGLPDSADAYQVVVVSSPVELPVWKWPRIVDRLEMRDIELNLKPGMKDPTELPLWFFSPALNLQAPARLAPKSGDELRVALKEGLNTLFESHYKGKGQNTNEQSEEEGTSKLGVKCVKAKYMSQQKTEKVGLYLVLRKSDQLAQKKPDKLGDIWIGKQGATVETRTDVLSSDGKYSFSKLHIVPFEGTDNETLGRLLREGSCS
jgi:gas vesicle protein